MGTGEGFSPREEEVIAHAASGLLDKEIAVKMGISIHTLHTYWKRIRQKVGPLSRSGIIHEWDRAQGSKPDLGQWSPFTRWIVDFAEGTFQLFSVSGRSGESRDLMDEGTFIHPADMRLWARHLDSLMQGKVNAEAFTFRAVDARQIYQVHSLASTLRGEMGAVKGLIGYWVKTPFPRQLDSDIAGGLWVASRALRLFHASKGTCLLFGLDPQSDSRNARAFRDRLATDSVLDLEAAYSAILRSNGGFMSRIEHLKPDFGGSKMLVQAAVELASEGAFAIGQAIDAVALGFEEIQST